MPVYEYQASEGGCPECSVVFSVLQSISEDPLSTCPKCGAAVKRVVSRVQMRVQLAMTDPDSAAKKGFTTFKKSGAGTWEKLAGNGPDAIVGSPEQIAAAKADKSSKVYDID